MIDDLHYKKSMDEVPETLMGRNELRESVVALRKEVATLRPVKLSVDQSNDRAKLRAECATLRAERDALVPVARLGFWALSKTRGTYAGDVNAYDVQTMATVYGVTAEVPSPRPCGSDCICDEAEAAHCFRDTDATTQARAVLDALMVGP